MSLTRRGVGLATAVAALWLVGRGIGVPELQVAAVAAAVIVSSAIAWAALVPSGLSVDRVVRPPALTFGATGTSTLTLTHLGRTGTTPLLVTDTAPSALMDDPSLLLEPMRPGERRAITLPLHGRQRGRARLGPVLVRASDPFGLVVRRRTLDAPGEVVVEPELVRLPPGLPLGGATTSDTDRRRTSMMQGEELADVREYVRGDDLRAVHWPSTAHRGRLMVRRTESNQAPSALVLLDRRAEAHLGRGADASFEPAVSIAASACEHLLARGRSVTLLDGPISDPPRARARALLLRHLAEVQTGPSDLARLLRQVGDGAAGDGALVAVLAVTEASDLRALVRAGRGFSSRAAIVIDAASFGDDAGGAGRLPADEAVAALRATGWRAVALGRGDSIVDRWTELVAGARARSHGARTDAVGSTASSGTSGMG